MLRSILSLLYVLLFATAALADSYRPPCPHKVESEDKKIVFIMLTAPRGGECGSRSPKETAEGLALRTKYSVSGLYENGEPAKLLWSVAEQWDYDRVFLANDRIHMIRVSNFGSGPESEAFALYKNGQQIKQYLIKDLVRDISKVTYSTTTARWSDHLLLHDASSTFQVKTIDGISYSIDLATGNILTESKPPSNGQPGANTADAKPSGRYCFGAFIFLGLAGILTFARRRH